MTCGLCGNEHKFQGPLYYDCPPQYKINYSQMLDKIGGSKMYTSDELRLLEELQYEAQNIANNHELRVKYLALLIDFIEHDLSDIYMAVDVIQEANKAIRLKFEEKIRNEGVGL